MRDDHTRMRFNPARRLPAKNIKGLHSSNGATLRLQWAVSLASTASQSGSLGELSDDRNGYHDNVSLWTMTFHNPSVSVNALDCHGGLGRKLRWHHQPATVIEQGCVHGGSFPHILAGVKPASWDLFLRLCRARLGPSCRSSWRRAGSSRRATRQRTASSFLPRQNCWN